jgi:hypothetical protein
LFLKCLLASRLPLFIVFSLIWFVSCNHCIIAYFFLSKNHEHSSSNHGLCYFYSYRCGLPLAEVLIFSLMFSQDLFMSVLLFQFSRDAPFHIKLLCCLFTYCQSFPNVCNHQILISITVSSHERSYI